MRPTSAGFEGTCYRNGLNYGPYFSQEVVAGAGQAGSNRHRSQHSRTNIGWSSPTDSRGHMETRYSDLPTRMTSQPQAKAFYVDGLGFPASRSRYRQTVAPGPLLRRPARHYRTPRHVRCGAQGRRRADEGLLGQAAGREGRRRGRHGQQSNSSLRLLRNGPPSATACPPRPGRLSANGCGPIGRRARRRPADAKALARRPAARSSSSPQGTGCAGAVGGF